VSKPTDLTLVLDVNLVQPLLVRIGLLALAPRLILITAGLIMLPPQALVESLYLLTKNGNFVLILNYLLAILSILYPVVLHLIFYRLTSSQLILIFIISTICLIQLLHLLPQNTVQSIHLST